MKRALTALALAGLAASTIAAGPQNAQPPAPDHSVELHIDDAAEATVEGNPDTFGTSLTNVVEGGDYGCEGTPEATCEVVLVHVTNPYEEDNARKGRERANLTIELNYGTMAAGAPVSLSDMAIQVWASDESGARGDLVGTADSNPPEGNEQMVVPVSTTEDETEAWYRVELIYGFHGGGYTANFSFA